MIKQVSISLDLGRTAALGGCCSGTLKVAEKLMG